MKARIEDALEGVTATIEDAIDGASEIPDPLDRLVERTKADPGAPFKPEVLERLAALKKEDHAAFELLRSQLKKVKCRVTELDKAMANLCGDDGGRKSQADILVNLAEEIQLFHTLKSVGFADIEVDGHRETWPIGSKGFRHWLTQRYFDATDGGAPGSEGLQSALNAIEAKARFRAPERAVYVRIGEAEGRLYLDLCDTAWRVIEISADGWRLIADPPVRFLRTAGMKSLPVPARGGMIETLQQFINVKSDDDFVLLVAWLLAGLRIPGPYPVLVLTGEQGTAKSTVSKILRTIVDPNAAPLRSLPRDDRDLFIAANNSHILAFDNVSGLRSWISDTLCRLATGAGFATRQLYSDQDEVLFDAARPIILNGITDIVARPDLADRAIFLSLEPIPAERRRLETEIWTELGVALPGILGALLDGVVQGLKPETAPPPSELPRMADFARWVAACEPAFWPSGTFFSVYTHNRDDAVESMVDADPVATAVRQLMAGRTIWTGTATDLLADLGKIVSEQVTSSKAWPTSPHVLAGRIRRAATFLRKTGLEITFMREGQDRTRIIHIAKITNPTPETGGT